MKIVIIGDGKVGSTLVEQLSKEGHDIVVIDNKGEVLEAVGNMHDVMCVEGDGISYKIQREAGVDECDLLIAATSRDEVNMLCCMIAKKVGAKHTIARVRNPEYADQMIYMKEELGLSMTINPERAAAREISRILRIPSALKVESFAKGRVELVEVKLKEGSPIVNEPLSSLYRKIKVKVLVCTVQRGEEVIIPDGNFVLKANDKITVTASPYNVEKFFKEIGLNAPRVRSVMIAGGSRISYYLTKQLIEMGIQVKIIEINEDRCYTLKDMLPAAKIIKGDCTDQNLLLSEGFDKIDAFVALTNMDEENVVLSMYANSLDISKVITKVNRIGYIDMIEKTMSDNTVISPKNITANSIIQYVRAMQNGMGSNIETLYKIVDGKAEALEFYVRQKSKNIGVPLKDLRLKKGILVASILRNSSLIIPGGNDTIELRDSVIVVTSNLNCKDLEDIFE